MDIDHLLTELTLEEKAALTIGGDIWHTAAVDRLGIPAIMMSDGPHGLRTQTDAGDHAGIGGSEPATCFPTACSIASSWDPDLIREVGAAIAAEARSLNVAVVLGPGVNIKRSPLCGRNFEYLSEDPYLAGELGLAIVEGIQSGGVGTSLKHYAANNQETDRLRVSADVDERTLREIYLPAFERIVTAGEPWTVMCAYNAINGVLVSQNEWLLTEVLRGEWGFDGLVVSDWGAVKDRVAALGAGLDLEMPPKLGISDKAVVEASREGQMSDEVLDLAVRHVLELVEKGAPVNDLTESVDFDAHHALARRAAAEGMVLLKNDGILPLQREQGEQGEQKEQGEQGGQRVLVVGEFARTARFQGGGSSKVNTTRTDSALDAFTEALGERVSFAPGFAFDGSDAERLRAEAVEAARDADVVVVFLGLTDAEESEGYDRTHISLPAHQTDLVAALADANENLVVTLANGSVVQLTGWDDRARAVLEYWLAGQASGSAVVDVLTGEVNPSGKLAETIPRRLEDNPSHGNFPGDSGHVRYGEGLLVGYRGYDLADREVAYPFGFGLSYTTFGYDELDVTTAGDAGEGTLSATVRVRVTNTDDRAGKEIVQVYVADPEASVQRPLRELKGFAKVALEPGQSETVTIELDQRAFSYWSQLRREWVVEAGEFEILAGPHSRELPLSTTITVDAPSVAAPLGEDSSLEEWLADPTGRAVLTERYSDSDGTLAGMFGDEELVAVIGNFPLERLMSFPMSPAQPSELDGLLAEVRRREG